jgi:hypothetical protein
VNHTFPRRKINKSGKSELTTFLLFLASGSYPAMLECIHSNALLVPDIFVALNSQISASYDIVYDTFLRALHELEVIAYDLSFNLYLVCNMYMINLHIS